MMLLSPYRFATAGSSYDLQEDFNSGSGVTPPSGWTAPASGTFSYSNTSPSLPQGGNNFSISAGSAEYTWKAFTSKSECWAYTQFKVASLAIGGAREIFSLKDSSGVSQCIVKLNTDGTLQIWDAYFNGTSTTAAILANADTYIWIHYKAGTGSNGVVEVKWSTTGTQPVSLGANYVQITNSPCAAAVERIALVSNDNNVLQYFDHVLENGTGIGDNP